MPDTAAVYRQLEGRIAAWAAAKAEVRAAIVVGSRARGVQPADDWSDLDVLLFVTDPDALIHRTDWLAEIGEVWHSFLSRTAGGDTERLVMFAGGYDVDFVFVPAEALRRAAAAETRPDIIRRGARILVDKEGLAQRTLSLPNAPLPSRPPAPEELAQGVGMFWYVAHYLAKQLCRGELWQVKRREMDLREMLLGAIETHARVVRGIGDTWHMGRFLERWADPRVVQALPEIHAAYDAGESWHALFAAIELFRWVTRETARKLGIEYPAEMERRLLPILREMRFRAEAH